MGLRRATPDDADELVRLRRVMYDAMDIDHASTEWAESCAALIREGLAAGWLGAYVVDADMRVRSGGVGLIARRLPGPRNPSGRTGHVQSMATDPEYRGRGYARAVFGALMAWFEEQGVPTVDLHATPYGEPLYRSFGFTEATYPALTRRRP
jgi:GNAT superfamily N-acetyltransferase